MQVLNKINRALTPSEPMIFLPDNCFGALSPLTGYQIVRRQAGTEMQDWLWDTNNDRYIAVQYINASTYIGNKLKFHEWQVTADEMLREFKRVKWSEGVLSWMPSFYCLDLRYWCNMHRHKPYVVCEVIFDSGKSRYHMFENHRRVVIGESFATLSEAIIKTEERNKLVGGK